MSHYHDYYVTQAQTGSGMAYFAGLQSQRGHGLGSFLGGLWRAVVPLLGKAAAAVGREALGAGTNFLSDVAFNRDAPTSSARRHFANAASNLGNTLAEKMRGNGIKRGRVQHVNQLTRGSRGRNITTKKARLALADNIFSHL